MLALQANLGPEELQLYVDFLTAVRGVAVSEEEVRSMSAAAIKNVDQARPLNAVRLPLWRLLAASA